MVQESKGTTSPGLEEVSSTKKPIVIKTEFADWLDGDLKSWVEQQLDIYIDFMIFICYISRKNK